jgi:hypothetical protein
MFKSIKEFFLGKPVEAPKVEEAPYKVEVAPVSPVAEITPEPVKAAPAKTPAVKKPAAPKKPAGAKGRGRKPKA